MRSIESVIQTYLTRETQYAIQITGDWGTGKTRMYQLALEPKIRKTEVHSNAKKKYKPVYISLFGLKSVEDIETKIVFEFYESKAFKGYSKKADNKKSLKITQGVLRMGIRGFLNFFQLGSVNEYLTDIKDVGQSVLDTDELLICFDDLERKHSDLAVADLIGYVNSLIDERIKVLLISNENLLLAVEGFSYLKEKVVGITIPFNADATASIKNIIQERYSGSPVYKDFLETNIQMVIDVSESANNNFRHITYALDNLKDFYSLVRKDIIDTKEEIANRLTKELPKLSKLLLAYSIEYKSSLLSHSDIEEYDDGILFLQDILTGKGSQDNSSNEDKSKVDKFLKKYEIDEHEYKLFKTIFYFSTFQKEFEVAEFVLEFKDKYNLEKGETPIHYKILNALSYYNFISLSDAEYQEKTKQVIEYAKTGKYGLANYLTIMHYAERMNNIFQFDLEKIRDELIEGFKVSLKKINQNMDSHFTQFEMSGQNPHISEWNKVIYKEGMKLIEDFRKEEENKKNESSIKLLIESPKEFKDKYYADENFKFKVSYDPLLRQREPKVIVEALKKTDNHTLLFLKTIFKDRFVDNEKVKEEIVAIKQVKTLLCEYKDELSKKGEKIRGFAVGELLIPFEKVEA